MKKKKKVSVRIVGMVRNKFLSEIRMSGACRKVGDACGRFRFFGGVIKLVRCCIDSIFTSPSNYVVL